MRLIIFCVFLLELNRWTSRILKRTSRMLKKSLLHFNLEGPKFAVLLQRRLRCNQGSLQFHLNRLCKLSCGTKQYKQHIGELGNTEVGWPTTSQSLRYAELIGYDEQKLKASGWFARWKDNVLAIRASWLAECFLDHGLAIQSIG